VEVAPEEPEVSEPEPEPEPAARETAEPTPQTETEPEEVEPGSIVDRGKGVTPPALMRQPNVVYPAAAVRLKREASVRMRILVDENGRPTEIAQASPKIGMGFDQAAMRAAKSTRWTPPTKNGVPVKMWVELSVDFRP
jgi:TonB family protein